ncbi:UPF0182 family protein [Methylomonas sp. SURF-1]|uniref:UPF0182 family protein n=1 Tax=Methylomonas aurea TaxID=2952224 RepID=A0ABT1UPK4_9GAMM|nr:UPF0182 family protein [Methylomonas sp. SURF-1]MCQ8183336.1 UPF0182 family protein [Methylomonas sp. SURF-1]
MLKIKRLSLVIWISIGIPLILYAIFQYVFLDFFVDLWWFKAIKFESYFWLRLLYRFILSGLVTLFFFFSFFFHFWIASRYLGLNPPDEILDNRDKRLKFELFAVKFINVAVKIYTPISLLLAVYIAIPFYHHWETALLYFFGGSSGVVEPVYGYDTSFYMLSYPLYQLIQNELSATAGVLLCLVGILYVLEHFLLPNQGKTFPLGAKIHLIVLIASLALFLVWGFLLERFSLLYIDTHEPVFFGPGFVQIRYQLPLIWLKILTFIASVVTVTIFIFSEKHRNLIPLSLSIIAFLSVIGLQKIQIIPQLIQEYIVNPNPVRTEKPFIKHNIEATLDAFDLKNVKTVELPIKLNAVDDINAWSTQKHFENIPVWDREVLIDTYLQLQSIRPYYTFLSVDEDRYFLRDHTRQVNLAARELNLSKLPTEAQNWENIHLRYTHGYGGVVTPAAQDADAPLTWYLRDLNLSSDVGLSVRYPDIYYGEENYTYAIEPNNLNIVKISGTQSGPDVKSVYKGVGGIPISSPFRKGLLAVYFQDRNLFFSPNITSNSQILMRRNITERIQALTPFLHLDKDPYLVVSKERFYWIQDAYTISSWHPVTHKVSEKFQGDAQEFNYIRNSVKIVVDALDGGVQYFISDPSDIIIQAYNLAYPSLFKNLNEMPPELLSHLRYARDLYYVQMKAYAKYHQQEPELFYQQAETWEFAKVRGQPVTPYYQTIDFGHCNGKEEYVLLNPMTPINSHNLSMIGMADTADSTNCDSAYKPTITIYKFLKDVQVNGPTQVESLIAQDPEVSAQFTLWNQGGTKVKLGRMVIMPMGNSVLYVQPVYIISVTNAIPKLSKIIVSIGNRVVMDTSFWSAFNRLKQMFVQSAELASKN